MEGESWSEWPFEAVIDFQEGPGIMARDFREAGIPLVRLAGLERGGSVLEGCNYLDPKTVKARWAHFALQEGDILLSTSASLGRIAVVGQDAVGAIAYTGIIRMRPRDKRLLAQFIRYLLEGPEFQQQAEMVGVGSVIRHFGPMHLRQMRVRLPSPPEQRAIAHILGTLDDKIELNRRMNETLEEMARALFKSWFVDFDPVRRRAEGRDPGLPKHLAELFPSRFVDSELGEIPEGWSVKALDEIADFKNGLALQRFRPAAGEDRLPVVKIADLRTGEASHQEWARADIEPACVIDDGDIVFSWSGSLIVVVWCGGRAALNQHLFRVTSETTPRSFVLGWLLHHLPSFQQIASDKATTMGHIQRHHLASARCVWPPPHTLVAAATRLEALLARKIAAELQAKTLRRCREALLPRLISGELRVKDADRFLAKVTA